MKKGILSEEIKRMQHLAGILKENTENLNELLGPMDKQFFEKTEKEIMSSLRYIDSLENKMYQMAGGNNGYMGGDFEDYDASTGHFTNVPKAIEGSRDNIEKSLANWKRRDNSFKYMSEELSNKLLEFFGVNTKEELVKKIK
jgi:hypothetical protein